MRVINVSLNELETKVLMIGFQGENEITQVRIDATEILTDYPNATPTLIVKPLFGFAYPVIVTQDGTDVVWEIDNSVLSFHGDGEIQLTFTAGTVIAKSYVGRIRIKRSLAVTGEAPDPIATWEQAATAKLAEVDAQIGELEDMVEAAEAAKDEAQDIVDDSTADIQAAGAAQVGNVNSAGTTQVGAVQAAGTEVLNSIPADYTELSDDVTDLKSAIGVEDIEYTADKAIVSGGIYTSSGNKLSNYIDVYVYEKVYLYAYMASDSIQCAFFNASKAIITPAYTRADGTPKGNNYYEFILTKPDNARYFAYTITNGGESGSRVVPSNLANEMMAYISNLETNIDAIADIVDEHDDEITEVNTDITGIREDIYGTPLAITWEQGGYNTNNGSKITSASNVRSSEMFTVSADNPVQINVKSGYRFRLFKYTTLGDLTSYETPALNWQTASQKLQMAGYYNIQIGKTDASNITIDDAKNVELLYNLDDSIEYTSELMANAFGEIGKYVEPELTWQTGKCIINGSILNATGYEVACPIEIYGNKVDIITSLAGSSQIAVFNSNGVAVQAYTKEDGTSAGGTLYAFTIDLSDYSSGYYLGVTSYNGHSASSVVYSSLYDRMNDMLEAAMQKNLSRFLNKKVLVIGDSISTGSSSYRAVYGQSYGQYEKWVDILIENGFFNKDNTRNDSIHATGFIPKLATADGGAWLSGENNFNQRLDYYISNNLASTYDIVILFGGINDYINNVPLGTGNDDYTVYFKSAVNHFFSNLVTNFTQARLMVVLPLRTPSATNSGGVSYDSYYDYIKEVARSYSLPCLDAGYCSGFVPSVNAFKTMWTYQGDGVHPNHDYQKKYLSEMIKAFIESY